MSDSSMNFPFYVLPKMMTRGIKSGNVGSYETGLAVPIEQLGNFPFIVTGTKLLNGATVPFCWET